MCSLAGVCLLLIVLEFSDWVLLLHILLSWEKDDTIMCLQW
jgi:hypothetical protein